MLSPDGGRHCKESLVQIIIDSSEPLNKVLDVVGALYGVELRFDAPPAATSPVAQRRAASPRTGRRGGSTRPQKRSRTAKASTHTRPSTPDPAAVRTWARENGQSVKDRGRVPAAVVEAYLAAGAAPK
jgi:hypothetical protein